MFSCSDSCSLSPSSASPSPSELRTLASQVFNKYKRLVGFRPTGWAKQALVTYGKAIRVWSIPYSEHSSFNELREFVSWLHPGNIIPTVNCNSQKKIIDMIHYLTTEKNPALPPKRTMNSIWTFFSSKPKEEDTSSASTSSRPSATSSISSFAASFYSSFFSSSSSSCPSSSSSLSSSSSNALEEGDDIIDLTTISAEGEEKEDEELSENEEEREEEEGAGDEEEEEEQSLFDDSQNGFDSSDFASDPLEDEELYTPSPSQKPSSSSTPSPSSIASFFASSPRLSPSPIVFKPRQSTSPSSRLSSSLSSTSPPLSSSTFSKFDDEFPCLDLDHPDERLIEEQSRILTSIQRKKENKIVNEREEKEKKPTLLRTRSLSFAPPSSTSSTSSTSSSKKRVRRARTISTPVSSSLKMKKISQLIDRDEKRNLASQ